jgi:hypothetical protein
MRRPWIAAAGASALAVLALTAPAWAKKSHPGPCHQSQVLSVVDRPGTGPLAAVSGSPCTVQPRVLELDRNEVTAGHGGSSNLSSYPLALVRFGVDKKDELIVLPPTMSLRAGEAGAAFRPAVGTQDSGFGWKRNFHNEPWYQDAVELFVTVPTCTHGYSAGAPTYSFGYANAFSMGALGISSSLGLTSAPGVPPGGGIARRFLSLQPSLTLSYSFTTSSAFFVNDSLSLPAQPHGGSSNALLVAYQRALSPGTVLDVETDYNLTPIAGYRQRAVGMGGAFYI